MTSLSEEEVAALADELCTRRSSGQTRAPLTDGMPLTMTDAYRVQAAVNARRSARGEHIVGWKLGYTSEAMRRQMGVADPNFGPLTDAMVLGSDATVPPTLLQPRVEPEIGLMFGRHLRGPVTVDEVLDAAAYAFAVLEVVDSVYTDYRFRIEDNTADGSSAAHVVIGSRLPDLVSLPTTTVDLYRNGVRLASALGEAASGHPARGVVWLVDQLASTGRRIEAGQFVITGGLTAATPLERGDVVSATFEGDISVAVRR